MEPLGRDFFDRPSDVVAPELLGKVVVHGSVALRLTEVEAYGLPGEDSASHTYRGMTPRNAVMFGPPGHLYVYFTYGMHFCANLVCRPEGEGSAVLLRAGEIVEGAERARARRGPAVRDRDLARGPARLATALGFRREENGIDACGAGPLTVHTDDGAPPVVLSGPRTGISSAADTPWRFWIEGDPTVSPYRAHVPRRRGTALAPRT
ncbi:DNA-3-methyladenine glycosylase [Spongiactinospora sp. TRM90649]|uniref:DNA-3-methyladenine glycosylase n=1 Tax=Spongiactinospora sp. TRM90649 TaxID=3031114 RepID=UPI0023F9867F|nr:DNA-3-methyladenine glycosylase [Spongiactinospora sp. TRM90649]MDF5751961.1 DNA-3-methyladenine glycosylase [Spongiactinospora sp. TRM90649]